MQDIPLIDIGPLFGKDDKAQAEVDRAIAKEAFDIGFMVITGQPKDLSVGADARATMLKLFDLPQDVQRPFWKRNFAP